MRRHRQLPGIGHGSDLAGFGEAAAAEGAADIVFAGDSAGGGLALALALTFPVVLTVNVLGSPDNGMIFAGYLGSLFLSGAYLAITCLTSAMTRNQVIAFIVAVVVCLALILVGFTPITDLLARYLSSAAVERIAGVRAMLAARGVRPTALQPFWDMAGFALGGMLALLTFALSVVAVPLIKPALLSVSPLGSEPDWIAHV